MRALVLLLVLLLGAAGAFFLFVGDTGGGPPPVTAGDDPAAKQPQDPGPAERSPTRIDQTPVQPPPTKTPDATAAAEDGTEAPKPTEPCVAVHVRSAADKAAVAEFQVTARSGTTTTRTQGKDGTATVTVAAAAELDLLVEAKGFQPWHGPATGPAVGEPPFDLDVFLVPAAVQAGIELFVRTLDGAPVERLRVEAYPTQENGDPAPWRRGQPLWSRIANGNAGRYRLPELRPGAYGIRALAADANGDLLPLLPFQRLYDLTGSNGFAEDVPLEPGCAFGLDLVDPAGASFQPSPEHGLTLSLRPPGGTDVGRRWVQTKDGRRVVAPDQLPGAGPTWLDEAITPGLYEFVAREGDRVRVQTQIALRGGERQLERVVVY